MKKQFKRNRILYFILVILVMILGIASRKFGIYLPGFLRAYAGDTLWALMVFLGFAFLFKDKPILQIAIFAIIFSYGIEISQLYKGDWIEDLRNTTLGGLILGYGFLWSDLICYTMGILIGVIGEFSILKFKK
ncbi:DUF2809 domain-containing protein [Clostridium tarantellae]|uniref:DUF2809 domain-containing protein n=1 Tax=Clostridium tarantellae TaxID=39493 RepID=A0A6I1MME0_9CLOT|nr:DUF2809 domain-containing protein [Clostridium tarantellae]MPQ44666.1 DUF2809 domain-containing protein [Clostridium tarantellae]